MNYYIILTILYKKFKIMNQKEKIKNIIEYSNKIWEKTKHNMNLNFKINISNTEK